MPDAFEDSYLADGGIGDARLVFGLLDREECSVAPPFCLEDRTITPATKGFCCKDIVCHSQCLFSVRNKVGTYVYDSYRLSKHYKEFNR